MGAQSQESLEAIAPRQLTPELTTRVQDAIAFLSTLADVDRALVMVEVGDQLKVAAAAGEPGYPPTSLLRKTLHQGKPLLVLDAAQDHRISENRLRSLVCVPFQDLVTGMRGLLYVDNQNRPAAFSYGDKAKISDFAAKLNSETALPTYRHDLKETAAPTSSGWLSLVALTLLVAMATLFPAYLLTPQAGWSAPPAQFERPYDVTRSFLELAQAGHLKRARNLLSPRLQDEVSPQQLEARCDQWDHSKQSPRRVLQEHVTKGRATVQVGRPRQEGSWQWQLVMTSEGWRIDSFHEGGS